MNTNLKYNNYSDQDNRAMEMAKPLTPRSERSRASYGSLVMSMQTSPGLCTAGVKCVRHDGHANECWPQ